MILFYTRKLIDNDWQRCVLLRFHDGEFPMPDRDLGKIKFLIRKHYPGVTTVFWSRAKWGGTRPLKEKRTFSTHPDYVTVVEAIKGELSDDLRSRTIGGPSKPLLDEITELSADDASFYTTRKAFKYHQQLTVSYKQEGGNIYTSNFHLYRRGVRKHRVNITITFD